MNNYNFKLEIKDEKTYLVGENFSNFTKLMQHIIFNDFENKNIYFIFKDNKIMCYTKINAGDIYNKLHSFFIKNSQKNYRLNTFQILFNPINEAGDEVDNIFKNKSLEETLEIGSKLIKKVFSFLKEDKPAIFEIYILHFEGHDKPIFYRIFLQNKD